MKKLEHDSDPNSKKVVVVGNRQEGVSELIDNPKDPNWRFHIMVRQGDRYAHMLATEEYLAELNYEPGHVIEGGRILVKEQMEPFKPDDDPYINLKRKNDKVCTKDGKPIYQKYYFTHDKKKQDIIIQEDSQSKF